MMAAFAADCKRPVAVAAKFAGLRRERVCDSVGEMGADDELDLSAKLEREEWIQARRLPPEEKIFAGPRLFESACRITLAGIRHQFPGASEETCREILRQRVEYQRKLEETA